MKSKTQKRERSRKRVKEVKLTLKMPFKKALTLLRYDRPYNAIDKDDDLKF